MEDIIYNLVNAVDVEQTENRIRLFRQGHQQLIEKNKRLREEEALAARKAIQEQVDTADANRRERRRQEALFRAERALEKARTLAKMTHSRADAETILAPYEREVRLLASLAPQTRLTSEQVAWPRK